jgi:hypothetical protein
MVWIIGLGIFAFLFFRFPAFRALSLLGGGILVLFIIWAINSSNEHRRFEKSLIKANEVQIANLRLTNGHMSGIVRNNSKYELSDVSLDVKAYDCQGLTITSDCEIIAEEKSFAFYLLVPPGQVRSLERDIYFTNMPPIKGHFLWNYTIVETEGKVPDGQ